MDMLLSTGERISCALCAMAINDLGHRAISLTGSQAGIVTDESHTKALILDVRADRIQAALEEDSIVLVAGFQGVSSTAQERHHARAAAARTRAPSRSPRRSAPRSARSTPTSPASTRPTRGSCPTRASSTTVSFEEMLEMAASGAGVLQLRSVEYARNHGVRIHCRSSFDDAARYLCRRRGGNDGAATDHSRHALDRPRRGSR